MLAQSGLWGERFVQMDGIYKRRASGRDLLIYKRGDGGPVVYWPVGAGEDAAGECLRVFELVKRGCKDGDFTLAAFFVEDWNRQLTPWQAPAVFGRDAFLGEGDITLEWLMSKGIPEVEEESKPSCARRRDFQSKPSCARWPDKPPYHESLAGALGIPELMPPIWRRDFQSKKRRYIAGYSLAGLFALWSLHRTTLFNGAAGCSASLWFPGWEDFADAHPLKEKSIVYLSLGKREEKTRTRVISCIGPVMRSYEKTLIENPFVISTELAWHDGGHFTRTDERMAQGILWLIRTDEDIGGDLKPELKENPCGKD